MQDLNRKSSLLNSMQAEHTQLEALLSKLSDEQLLRPGATGSWSVKDVLAHITWWEQTVISETLHGVELDPGLGEEPWSLERANTLMVEAKRDTPLPEILAAFHASYLQILQMVEGLSDTELARDELYTHLINNTWQHYAEHRRWIEDELNLSGSPTTP